MPGRTRTDARRVAERTRERRQHARIRQRQRAAELPARRRKRGSGAANQLKNVRVKSVRIGREVASATEPVWMLPRQSRLSTTGVEYRRRRVSGGGWNQFCGSWHDQIAIGTGEASTNNRRNGRVRIDRVEGSRDAWASSGANKIRPGAACSPRATVARPSRAPHKLEYIKKLPVISLKSDSPVRPERVMV